MISVRITSKNFAVVLKSAQMVEERVGIAAGLGLARALEYIVTIIQEQYLSGPRPLILDVRTTRLRQSIVAQVAKTARGVIGRIGTNIVYGAFHEFGFHGTVNVRPHMRAIRQLGARGQPLSDNRRRLFDKAGNLIGFKESLRAAFSRRKGDIQSQLVPAHVRRIDYAGRPFVRPALEQALPLIEQEIQEKLKQLN